MCGVCLFSRVHQSDNKLICEWVCLKHAHLHLASTCVSKYVYWYVYIHTACMCRLQLGEVLEYKSAALPGLQTVLVQ